jgi:thioredoxin 1
MRSILFIISTALFFSSCTGQQFKLAPIEFNKQLIAASSKNLVDVRTPDEFNEGHITYADNIDWNGPEFENLIERYDKSTPIFVYCLSGGRSGNAAKKMRALGFKNVYELLGGMMAWRASHLPELGKNIARSEAMTRVDFEKLYKGKSKKILIDFYADWCAPCKKMKPYLDALEASLPSKLEVIRLNADSYPELCQELKIEGLPCFLFYQNDTLVWKRLGYIDQAELKALISK